MVASSGAIVIGMPDEDYLRALDSTGCSIPTLRAACRRLGSTAPPMNDPLEPRRFQDGP
jgi:hypothetical protein